MRNFSLNGRLATAASVVVLAASVVLAQTPDIQHKTAAELNWKRAFEKDAPPPAETEHLLVYGKVPDKDLKAVAAELEKQFDAAYKALAMDPKRDMWEGKLTVYLIPDKADFGKFIRRVERRYPEEGELGTVVVRSDNPHVIAGPAHAAWDPAVDGQAGEQIANALLMKKVNADLPSWVRSGFGRATVVQAGTAAQKSAERERVKRLLDKKLKAADAWGNSAEPAEASVLRGSVIAYLAYSGRTSKFVPFVMAFRPGEDGQEPTTANALKVNEIDPGKLHMLWRNWIFSGK